MNVSLHIARRYLFSKKSRNVINIISGISMVGVGIGAFALIVVLSAFNGLENLVESLYYSFDPQIKVMPAKGKTFDYTTVPLNKIEQLANVEYVAKSLEETALVKYKEKQVVATIKGVDNTFIAMSGLDSMMYSGELTLEKQNTPVAVIGYGISDKLGCYVENNFSPLQIYAARKGVDLSGSPDNAFSINPILPIGIFAINPDFDYTYVLVPYTYAESIFERKNQITSLEISLKADAEEEEVKQEIAKILGDGFTVKTRYELNEVLFKTNNTEKWIVFLILCFILVVATFNIVGSLTMLILEKKADIYILMSMGATRELVRNIFFLEGLLISLVGGLSGLLLGVLLVILQAQFGFVKLEGLIVDYYPVAFEWQDFAIVLFMIILIGALSAWIPAQRVVPKKLKRVAMD